MKKNCFVKEKPEKRKQLNSDRVWAGHQKERGLSPRSGAGYGVMTNLLVPGRQSLPCFLLFPVCFTDFNSGFSHLQLYWIALNYILPHKCATQQKKHSSTKDGDKNNVKEAIEIYELLQIFMKARINSERENRLNIYGYT
jgi:hypothetical protein